MVCFCTQKESQCIWQASSLSPPESPLLSNIHSTLLHTKTYFTQRPTQLLPKANSQKSYLRLYSSERPEFLGEAQFSSSGLNITPHYPLINELKRQVHTSLRTPLPLRKEKYEKKVIAISNATLKSTERPHKEFSLITP